MNSVVTERKKFGYKIRPPRELPKQSKPGDNASTQVTYATKILGATTFSAPGILGMGSSDRKPHNDAQVSKIQCEFEGMFRMMRLTNFCLRDRIPLPDRTVIRSTVAYKDLSLNTYIVPLDGVNVVRYSAVSWCLLSADLLTFSQQKLRGL